MFWDRQSSDLAHCYRQLQKGQLQKLTAKDRSTHGLDQSSLHDAPTVNYEASISCYHSADTGSWTRSSPSMVIEYMSTERVSRTVNSTTIDHWQLNFIDHRLHGGNYCFCSRRCRCSLDVAAEGAVWLSVASWDGSSDRCLYGRLSHRLVQIRNQLCSAAASIALM